MNNGSSIEMALRLIIADDPAAEAAKRIVSALRLALASGQRAAMALSGGETPWLTLARLEPGDLDWTMVDVFQVDERIVAADHPDRNLRRLRESLRVPAIIHPMPVDAAHLDRAAADYAASLPPAFDLVQLGLGGDGHTASLLPGDPVLRGTGHVAITGSYQGHRRMTLTFAPINRARLILWIVTGAAKREALAALNDGNADIPANRVARRNAIVIADKAAMGSV
jgi:6-phosphogluconolactonase